MGGAENALLLKILVCWLKWLEGAAFGADITSEIACTAATKSIPLKPGPVHPQVYTFISTSGDFTTCL